MLISGWWEKALLVARWRRRSASCGSCAATHRLYSAGEAANPPSWAGVGAPLPTAAKRAALRRERRMRNPFCTRRTSDSARGIRRAASARERPIFTERIFLGQQHAGVPPSAAHKGGELARERPIGGCTKSGPVEQVQLRTAHPQDELPHVPQPHRKNPGRRKIRRLERVCRLVPNSIFSRRPAGRGSVARATASGGCGCITRQNPGVFLLEQRQE